MTDVVLRRERHLGHCIGWLRAAVLGANDGIVSVAAIIVGVASAQLGRSAIHHSRHRRIGRRSRLDGGRGVRFGSSQADAERADLRLERREPRDDPAGERAELAAVYRARGLSAQLAEEVATELSSRDDVLAVHARDELGMTALSHARPLRPPQRPRPRSPQVRRCRCWR